VSNDFGGNVNYIFFYLLSSLRCIGRLINFYKRFTNSSIEAVKSLILSFIALYNLKSLICDFA
jgi:hypothetical protein